MASSTTQRENSTAAIIFAVFAVVCLIAFLAYRGSDVGQLPQLVGNLGGGPILGTGSIDHLFDGFKALTIGFGWLIVGGLVLFTLDERSDFKVPQRVGLLLAATMGSAIWSLIWFFLGVAGLYTPWTAIIAMLVTGVMVFIAAKLQKKGDEPDEEDKNGLISIFSLRPKVVAQESVPRSALERVLLGIVIFQVAIAFIASLAPPTAKDTLLYHFSLPKTFIAQHGLSVVEGNIASYLSLGTEMQVVWARLISPSFERDGAAGPIVWLFFPLLLLAVYAWSQELGLSRVWSLMAATIVATIPSAYHVASSGYIDLSLALYITLATYSLTRWWRNQHWGWVLLIGVFLGAALSVKLTTVFVIAAFGLIILLRARNDKAFAGKIVGTGFAALVLAGVIASPWYLRTWVATGSPVFPFYLSMWKGTAPGWDVERSNLFQAMNSQYGGANKGVLDYVLSPVKLSVMAQPEESAYFDGVLGVAFLIGLPLLGYALWKLDLAVEIKIMAGVAGVMYLFWLFSSEQLRYLLPIVPILAIAIAAASEKIGGQVGRIAKLSLIAAAVCGLLTAFAWSCQKAPLRVVLGGETRDEYLARNLDYYPYYQEINANAPADAKVWLIDMRRDTYNLDRPVVSDYLFEDWTLRKMLWEARSSQELKARAASLGVQYILTRHDFLFDYDRSTLVDDKKPRAENEAKLKMARDLVLDPVRTIKADDKFSLVKLY